MLLASSFSWKRVVGDSQVGSTAEAGALAPPLEAIDDEDAEFEIRADGHLGMWGGPLECEADLANAESAPSHAGDAHLCLCTLTLEKAAAAVKEEQPTMSHPRPVRLPHP